MGIARRLQIFALCITPCSWPATPTVVDDGIVIEDVTLISPERPVPMPRACVVIRNGQIAEIGTNLVAGPHATKIDGRGRYLIPGLIDSHVHVGYTGPLDDDAIAAHPELLRAYRSQIPRSYLAFGFTTLVDLDLKSPDTLHWFNEASYHPNLFHCGCGIRIAGGYGAMAAAKDSAAAKRVNLVYEPAEAKYWPASLDPRDYSPARAVDRVVDAGGICVKVFEEPGFGGVFHWPVFSAETLNSLRAETRRRGLVLVIHANAVESWRAALGAHADVIVHGLWHWAGDRLDPKPPREARDIILAAARAGVAVQPTLQTLYGDETVFDRSLLDDPRLKEALPPLLLSYLRGDEAQASYRAVADGYRQMIAQIMPGASPAQAMAIAPARVSAALRIMTAEKVKLLFGTDTGTSEGFGNPPGLNGRMEMAHWVEAGVPLARILRAATLDNAASFGLSKELGSIEVGKRADLLLLRADPLQAITAYDTIDTIISRGHPIPRASLLPQ